MSTQRTFTIYVIEDDLRRFYYIGSRFGLDIERRFVAHQNGTGGSKALTAEMQKKDAAWTIRPLAQHEGTLEDCHLLEEAILLGWMALDQRKCLNKILPRRLKLTSEACREGQKAALAAKPQSSIDSQKEKVKVWYASLTYEELEPWRERARRAAAQITPERRRQMGLHPNSLAALRESRKKRTYEDYCNRFNANVRAVKLRCNECGLITHPGPMATHQHRKGKRGHQGTTVVGEE